jgi:ankyrin repeat protein
LIEAGANVHAVDHTGSCALHYATSQGKLDVVQELLNKSAPLSVRNHKGYTPLTSALKRYPKIPWGKIEVCTTINFLLDVGADPLSTLPDGRTALHCIAEMLMNKSNVDRERQIEEDIGEDHFTTATQLYQRFLAAGCDREARDNDGNTPIFYYVSAPKPDSGRDHSDFARPRPSNPEDYKKMFSEHDVNKINNKGDSLLHSIARRQKWPCDADEGEKLFSTLVDLGLSPWKENSSGQTALDIAAAHEKPKILALFARDD